jgi:hypothetical protein
MRTTPSASRVLAFFFVLLVFPVFPVFPVFGQVPIYQDKATGRIQSSLVFPNGRALTLETGATVSMEQAHVRTILDVLGAEVGAMLVRTESGWALLSPGTSGYVLTAAGTGAIPQWAVAPGGGGGSGTVTSVGLSMPSGFSVASSPVTLAGTLAVTLTDAPAFKSSLSLGNVENTALSTWTGSANINTVGTISSGVWGGSTISEVRGGTAQSTYSAGDMLYASGTNTLAKLSGTTAAGRAFLLVSPSANQVYYYNGSAWATVTTTATGRSLMAATAATLTGLGITSGANLDALGAVTGNGIRYQSGTNTWGTVTVGSGLTFAGGTLAATAATALAANDEQSVIKAVNAVDPRLSAGETPNNRYTATLSGNITLVDDPTQSLGKPLLVLDPGGSARTITLPSIGATNYGRRLIVTGSTGTIAVGSLTLSPGQEATITPAAASYLVTGGLTPATDITNTPAGTIAAATVQLALNELDTEKQGTDTDLTSIAGGVTGLVKGAGNGGGYSAASAGTDYVAPDADITSIAGGVSGVVKGAGNGSGYSAAARSDINTIQSTGTYAAPTTSFPYSPAASLFFGGIFHLGATGTMNLPAGAAGMNFMVVNTGAFTLTIDPNASEAIRRAGTLQTGGVSITLSSGAGNYVALYWDGSVWATAGSVGTVAQGS